MTGERPAVADTGRSGRKVLGYVVRLGLSLALIGYLVFTARQTDPTLFERLRFNASDAPALAAAWGCLVAALLAGWARWWGLARGLGLIFPLRAAFRFGFFGYVLDFLALGTAGGDAGRAYLLGRSQRGRWAEAAVSVVLDRLLGLWALALVAAVATVALAPSTYGPETERIVLAIRYGAASGLAAIALLALPRTRSAIVATTARVPRLRNRIEALGAAVASYRNRPALLLLATLSLAVPCLNVTAFYLIATTLTDNPTPLGDHFVIIPPAMLSGVIPLPMEALGVFEYVVDTLYARVAPDGPSGLLVALSYRLLTFATLFVGLPLYYRTRRDARADSEGARSHG